MDWADLIACLEEPVAKPDPRHDNEAELVEAAIWASKIEYSQLAEVGVFANPDGSFTKLPSCSALYRVLEGRGLTNFRCKKHPKLPRGMH
jgi:hypothetical protein